jgi:hypothetical protein
MAQKMTMTGAISVVAPGSSFQILFGIIIMNFYLLAVVRAGPYVRDVDDGISILTTLALVMTNVFAMVLMSITYGGGDNSRAIATIDSVMVTMNVIVLVVQVFTIVFITHLGLGPRLLKCLRNKPPGSNRTKVEPASAADGSRKVTSHSPSNDRKEEEKSLRDWR